MESETESTIEGGREGRYAGSPAGARKKVDKMNEDEGACSPELLTAKAHAWAGRGRTLGDASSHGARELGSRSSGEG